LDLTLGAAFRGWSLYERTGTLRLQPYLGVDVGVLADELAILPMGLGSTNLRVLGGAGFSLAYETPRWLIVPAGTRIGLGTSWWIGGLGWGFWDAAQIASQLHRLAIDGSLSVPVQTQDVHITAQLGVLTDPGGAARSQFNFTLGVLWTR
jgi:hypothetical protein